MRVLILFTISILLTSCYKKEFLPPELGEAIPYTDSLPSFNAAFAASPYTLFLHAWRRSSAHKQLDLANPDTRITLLVPDNAAMEAAGYNLPKLNTLPLRELDSLVLYHTALSYLHQDGLQELENKGNVGTRSALTNKNDWEFYAIGTSHFYTDYHYKIYVGNENSDLLINGKNIGNIKDIIPTKQAILLPIKEVLKRPTKTTWEYLKADGRFSLYTQSIAYTDSIYKKINEFYFGRGPLFNLYLNTTLLVPTDEAFHKAGLMNFEDIKKIIHRVPDPYKTAQNNLSHFTPIDSILDNHYWNFNITYLPDRNNHMSIYSNDLKNNLFGGNYVHFVSLIASITNFYSLDPNIKLQFTNNNASTYVHLKNSNFPAAEFVETDIVTLTGVVHVLDHLLIPKDFKFN